MTDRRRLRLTFTKFAVASAVATAISQLVLIGEYWLLDADATTASTIAFLAGAVPHFLMLRHWAWGQRGRLGLRQHLLSYVAVTGAGGLLSVATTTLVDALVSPMITDRATLALVLNFAYLAGGLPVFLAKFFVLDKVFLASAARAGDQVACEESSSTSVRVANPVAPAATSS